MGRYGGMERETERGGEEGEREGGTEREKERERMREREREREEGRGRQSSAGRGWTAGHDKINWWLRESSEGYGNNVKVELEETDADD